MTNTVALALNEFMKSESVPALQIMEKYKLTPSEFWKGYSQLKAKAPR